MKVTWWSSNLICCWIRIYDSMPEFTNPIWHNSTPLWDKSLRDHSSMWLKVKLNGVLWLLIYEFLLVVNINEHYSARLRDIGLRNWNTYFGVPVIYDFPDVNGLGLYMAVPMCILSFQLYCRLSQVSTVKRLVGKESLIHEKVCFGKLYFLKIECALNKPFFFRTATSFLKAAVCNF